MAPRAQIKCKIKRCVYLVHFSCEKNTIREQDGLNHHLYKNYLMIGQKVYKSESNNLIMFIAVSLVLGLSLPVFGFSILFKLFIFAMRKYIPSKS